MPTTGLILEPLTGDTVTQPVVVKVGYTTTTNFNLNCRVHTTNETMPQPHPPPPSPGTHVSSGILPGAGTWTAYGDNATTGTNLDNQQGVIVLAMGGAPPVIVDAGSGMVVMVRGKKKRRPVKGTTIATAIYVVCVVYEVDTAAGTRTIIAVAADMVKHTGHKHKWSVTVKLKIKKPDNFQYVARVTAYDQYGVSLGTQSKQIKK